MNRQEFADWLEEHAAAHTTLLAQINEKIAELRRPDNGVPWDRDISGELARNPGPYTNSYLQQDGGWWPRSLPQIDGVTIHHTLSDSPHATAQHYVNKDGGRPSIPYTVWISQTGEILLCVPLTEGLWHDHTGHENTHLSVGLAGQLHLHHPADVQLEAAVKVCKWAVETLPGVTSADQVKGHRDFAQTICPGWQASDSGYWRDDFYAALRRALA